MRKIFFILKNIIIYIVYFLILLSCKMIYIIKIINKQKYTKYREYIKSYLRTLKVKIPLSKQDINNYLEYVLNNQLDKSNFVSLSNENYKRTNSDPKIIAYYLPQYHSFEENINWFGRGFTEWSNTSKAVPQWTNHWQPHIPIDVGYYSLEDNLILKRQVELAKQYGIYGFCYYYYWFSGKKIMEKPINNMLKDKSIDMPFFIFWANENWTKLWGNGEEKEILCKQELKNDDDEKFMNDILPFMKDDRYIKINNKPILIIYNLSIFPKERFLKFKNNINNIAKQNGFDGLEILTIKNNNAENEIKNFEINGTVDFYPCNLINQLKIKQEKIINKKFKGVSYDIEEYINNKKYLEKENYKSFKGCFPNWDNTARKCYIGSRIIQNTPKNYKTWLSDIIKWTKENKKENEQFIFINAWNEWAEGAHLEPDQKYGYAFLQATKEALEENQ